MTATERHAIRHAIPALSVVADRLRDSRPLLALGVDEVIADLRDALDGETPSEASDVGSGPTTAQEGPEGRSGRNSGVSGDAERVERLTETLQEVLGAFTERGYPGESCRRTGWIRDDRVRQWLRVMNDDIEETP